MAAKKKSTTAKKARKLPKRASKPKKAKETPEQAFHRAMAREGRFPGEMKGNPGP